MQEWTGCYGSDSDREGKKKETLVFEMESPPIHYTRAVSTYNLSLAACTPQCNNVAEDVIHSWGIGSSWEEVLAQLSEQGHREVPTTFPWWTNEMDHISRVPV